VDQSEFCAKGVCDGGRAFGATGVGADDDALFEIGDVSLNVLFENRSSVEVVHWDIEEALVLRVVQVHGDDVICAGASQEVGDQCSGLCDPLSISRTWFEGRFIAFRDDGSSIIVYAVG